MSKGMKTPPIETALEDTVASVEKRSAARMGRRRPGEIPYPQIERLLIHGELRQYGDREVLRYPSLRELGRRFEIDVAQLSRWAKRRNVLLLRSLAEAARSGDAPPTAAELKASLDAVRGAPPAPAGADPALDALAAVEAVRAAQQGVTPPVPPEVEAVLDAARAAAREQVLALPGLDPLPPPDPNTPRPTPVPRPGQVGRLHHTEPPRYSVETLDRLLVFGEPYAAPDGTVSVRYPANKEIAERLGISHGTVVKHWRKQHCGRRRAEARARIAARVEEKLVEQTAEQIALSRERIVHVVDKFLGRFEMAIDDGTARTDLPADFERLVRLREFLLGNAESRTAVEQTLSLDMAQQQHAQVLRDVDEATAAEMGLVIDTTAVEVIAPATPVPAPALPETTAGAALATTLPKSTPRR
jgi:AcrR family transcriptional regulator